MTTRAVTAVLFCSLAQAQSPADLFSKAPPAIEDALRARITKFYEAHRDGKFRVADQFVAEDSKDVFFESDKRRCKTFEVAKISYADAEFSKASVLVMCQTSILMPPAGLMELKMPLASKWKSVGGEWFWYVEAKAARESPFGGMKPGEGTEGGLPAAIPKGPDPRELMSMVTADKDVLEFQAGKAGRDELVISSQLPGQAQLVIDGPRFPDIKLELDRSALEGKQSAKLVARYQPDGKHPRSVGTAGEFRIVVQPVNKVIPVKVNFKK